MLPWQAVNNLPLETGDRASVSNTTTEQQPAAATPGDAPQPQRQREQCLECDSLMEQLRETSDEVQQLQDHLADTTKALQVGAARNAVDLTVADVFGLTQAMV